MLIMKTIKIKIKTNVKKADKDRQDGNPWSRAFKTNKDISHHTKSFPQQEINESLNQNMHWIWLLGVTKTNYPTRRNILDWYCFLNFQDISKNLLAVQKERTNFRSGSECWTGLLELQSQTFEVRSQQSDTAKFWRKENNIIF